MKVHMDLVGMGHGVYQLFPFHVELVGSFGTDHLFNTNVWWVVVYIFRMSRVLPVWSGPQLQIGLWLKTSHLAFNPHVPWQGSIHFWFTQACVIAHSLLVVHSGRHCGGVPIKPCKHEQTEWPLISLHWLLGPQGEGLHGCSSRCGGFGVSICVHTPIGLPVYPGMHMQFGEWFCTRHSAFTGEKRKKFE